MPAPSPPPDTQQSVQSIDLADENVDHPFDECTDPNCDHWAVPSDEEEGSYLLEVPNEEEGDIDPIDFSQCLACVSLVTQEGEFVVECERCAQESGLRLMSAGRSLAPPSP
jgi:hypothetical protein